MNREPLLSIRGLRKRFGGLLASDGVDLDLREGEIHALIGPNGAGKTTLIAQLFGELRQDEGSIRLAGAEIGTLPTAGRVGRGLARTFQITQLLPDFTMLDNVALAVQARRGHSFRFLARARQDAALRSQARRHLAAAGLGERAGVKVADLSHGEQKQLEFAVALACAPRLLLLDEPMAGLSHVESEQMVAMLAALKGRVGMLLVEHDMDAVFALADRISVLVYGRVIATGTAAEIRANPEVRAAYLGEGGRLMLSVRKLQAAYGASRVLFDVGLDIAEGEVVTLIGRNGMGKTTTVRAIMGLLAPQGGEIRFEGRDISGSAPERIARCGIGLVPEGRQVFPTLSVRENLVATAANRLKRPSPWTLERVYALFPSLKERAGQSARTLSGGEQQMLAIGRALMTNPKLVVLDEATEGLAPVIRAEIWGCLAALKAQGQSILLIDKNVEVLKRIADRHYVIEKGRTVWSGSSADLAADAALVHRHVGI